MKHARDLGVALQEKARAESELAKARAALADARAEADALIHQKQHPKARAFHKLEQRVADMEDRYIWPCFRTHFLLPYQVVMQWCQFTAQNTFVGAGA